MRRERAVTELRPGLVGEVELVVTPGDTADAAGNEGVNVLSTPRLVRLIEEASMAAIQAGLAPGEGSVGIRVEMRHLAATPLGMRVRARAVLREVDGRRLVFDVEAHDEVEKVADGVHERFQVHQERFLQRIQEKARARP
ncbi:MAG: thioesterase family protein [Candidatus Rokubacteria bacterium]|nr:thioesterase family protein [Candidatus Rokubacteria bacterium]